MPPFVTFQLPTTKRRSSTTSVSQSADPRERESTKSPVIGVRQKQKASFQNVGWYRNRCVALVLPFRLLAPAGKPPQPLRSTGSPLANGGIHLVHYARTLRHMNFNSLGKATSGRQIAANSTRFGLALSTAPYLNLKDVRCKRHSGH